MRKTYWNRPFKYADVDQFVAVYLRTDMKYTHLLELSTTEPRQYRITVLEDTHAALIGHSLSKPDIDDFTIVGYYDSPEELMKVLELYLAMEQGK